MKGSKIDITKKIMINMPTKMKTMYRGETKIYFTEEISLDYNAGVLANSRQLSIYSLQI